MTYSGLLSLVHAEVDAGDERVQAAVEWLARHYSLDENPGQGQQGLYYYYLVMAKALTAAGLDTLPKQDGSRVNWRQDLARKLLTLQKADGSWANDSGRWMEKDPNGANLGVGPWHDPSRSWAIRWQLCCEDAA
jgi:squalene-hopene/tetraprenyl-beta-curcumene cyclase